MFFNLLEKAKVSAGAGFKRFLAELGSSPISHPIKHWAQCY
jgi:hypothetical protein